MKKQTKRIIAAVLTWAMIFTTFFGSMTPLQLQAAELDSTEQAEVVVEDVVDEIAIDEVVALEAEEVETVEEADSDLVAQAGEIPSEWARLIPSANNNNGHFGNASRAPEAFVLSAKDDVTDESLSATFRLMSAADVTRVRFVTKYVNDNQWGYISMEPNSSGDYVNWGIEHNASWGTLSGLPAVHQYDVFSITTSYVKSGDTITGLNVAVNNITTGESGNVTVTDSGLISLGSVAGKVGIGAAYYELGDGTIQKTDLCVANVKVAEEYITQFAFYRPDIEGQSFDAVSNADIEAEINDNGSGDGGNTGGGDETPDVNPNDDITKEDGEGRAWWTLNAGPNNGGGHNYGNASSAAPVVLLDKSKTMAAAGALSMAIKPNTNWGIFYSYVDDNHWLYVGHDGSSGWYYQYKYGNTESYPKIGQLATPVEGEEMAISISLDRETLRITVDGNTVSVTNQALISWAEAVENVLASDNTKSRRFGVKTNGANTSITFADVTYNGADCMNDTWGFAASRQGQSARLTYAATAVVAGVVTDEAGAVIPNATVRIGTNSVKTNESGAFTFDKVELGTHTVAVTKGGYEPYVDEAVNVTAEGANLTIQLIAKQAIDLGRYDTISNNDMKVYVGKDFPLVARYEMNKLSNTFFKGNETNLNTIAINGTEIVPTVLATSKNESNTAKTYELKLKDEAAAIDLTMTVVISIEENTLTWEVTELKKEDGCARIATINIPQLNLLTVDTSEEEAVFAGAQASTTTTVKADYYITFEDGFAPMTSDGYLYAFLSNGKLSAGLFSNSEVEGDKRVVRNNGADNMGLSSAVWYYEMGDAAGQAALARDPEKYGDSYPVSELPIAKVAIADDVNKDGDIDWNDGALAYRKIMHTAYGSEGVKDMVNHRIVMNFSSMAPNPFLATADNIKKVYLATDGLPQSIVLKGYGNEGHDSANSEYADIAEREGGVKDFQNLIKIAHDYNTEIGIHVNAQEIYPEAKSMNNTMVNYPNVSNGWGWLDQSHVIDKHWDLASQARWKRLVQLYDRINNTNHLNIEWPQAVVEGTDVTVDMTKEELKKEAESLPDNMDLIYLDVWYQDAWETRRIAEEFNSLGWRFSTEFSAEGEYDSTWQHWSTDATYGGAGMKGYNSDIIRFIRNDQRDSQVLNYPEFGGTADNPLLGGYRLYGFEGWGGDQDFNRYIKNTFNENLPTRFFQHYYVTDWTNYGEGEESPVGNTEKEIKLMNDNGDVVIVTRNEEQRSDDNIERTVSFNGTKVLDDVTYLLPWTDNQNGEVKLYHWNLEGGETTWELIDEYADCETVVMYELSDQGRINKQVVNVVDGKVTLNAKEATAYILLKEEAEKTLKNDFGEYDYVVDPGFNGYEANDKLDAKEWSGDIADESIQIERATTGDQRLAFNSPAKTVSVKTQIHGLTKGTEYVAEVYVQNSSEAKAYIAVNAGEKEVSEYTEESILTNYVQCDTKHGTKMQRMQVSFVAEDETAELILTREAGEGSTYVDDIRIVEIDLNNWQEDGSFVQDFEEVVQGLYPFVIGSSQGTTDHRTHLSQLNAPYTQKGWNNRVIDDVIDGEWSLKHHTASTGIVYQTIPANFRFEPGKVYTVEFDYQSGPDKAYAMVVGDGTSYTRPTEDEYFAQAHGAEETTHVTMEVIGSGSGQTWIGLYQDGGRSGSGSMGQTDFVLDNLVIREVENAIAVTLDKTLLYVGEEAKLYGTDLDEIVWTSSDDSVAAVDALTQTVKAYSEGTVTLTAILSNGEIMEFVVTVKDTIVSDIPREEFSGITATANTEENAAGEPTGGGTASHAVDGNANTYWHSQWQGAGFTVSETNPAVITVDLGKAMTIGGFKFLQRSNGNNGVVINYNYEAKDAEGNTVETGSKNVTGNEYAQGAWVITEFTKEVEAKTIVISVTQGYGNFAAIAEIQPIDVEFKEGEAAPEKPVYDLTLSGTVEKVYDGKAISEDVFTVTKAGSVSGNDSVSGNSAEVVKDAVIKYYNKSAMTTPIEGLPTKSGNYWAQAVKTTEDGKEIKSNVLTFRIEKASISVADVEYEWKRDTNAEEYLAVKSVVFEGLAEGDVLAIDTDYRASFVWDENTNEVTAAVTLRNSVNSKNYKLTEATFTKGLDIEKAGIVGVWVDGIKDLDYTGKKLTQNIKVFDGKKLLTEKKDYTVSYKNNQNAYTLERDGKDGKFTDNAPQIILKMKGDYKGTKVLNFQILPVDISVSENGIVADDLYMDSKAKKTNQKVNVAVTWNGKKLGKKDFTVTPGEVDITKVTTEPIAITVKGMGNFTGERIVYLTVGEKKVDFAMSKVKVTLDGKAKAKVDWIEGGYKFAADQIVVKNGKDTLVQGTHYKVKGYENNDKVGTATLILEGIKGSRFHGQKRVTFQIKGIPMKQYQVYAPVDLKKVGYTYTGEEIELLAQEKVTVASKTDEAKILTLDKDFTAVYSKNLNKGTASVVLTGCADAGYEGTLKVTYKIAQEDVNNIDIRMESDTVEFMKGGAKAVLSVSHNGIQLTEGKDFTVTYKNNKAVTEDGAKAQAVIKGKGNYIGTKEGLSFNIISKSISSNDITVVVKDKEVAKNGKWKQSFKVYDADGKVLKAKKDYVKEAVYEKAVKDEAGNVVSYVTLTGTEKITDACDIRITITGMDGYKGTTSVTYKLLAGKHDVSKATVQVNDQFYNGEKVTIKAEKDFFKKAEIKGVQLFNEDGTANFMILEDSYQKNDKKGTAKVTIRGIGEFGGEKVITFKIKERDIEQTENWWESFKESFKRLFGF